MGSNQPRRSWKKHVVTLGDCRKKWKNWVRNFQSWWVLWIWMTLIDKFYKTFCNNVNKQCFLFYSYYLVLCLFPLLWWSHLKLQITTYHLSINCFLFLHAWNQPLVTFHGQSLSFLWIISLFTNIFELMPTKYKINLVLNKIIVQSIQENVSLITNCSDKNY